MDTFAGTSVAARYKHGLAKYQLERLLFMHARIRSRSGIIAGITIKHSDKRLYSEADHAFIGAIGTLTSLALS